MPGNEIKAQDRPIKGISSETEIQLAVRGSGCVVRGSPPAHGFNLDNTILISRQNDVSRHVQFPSSKVTDNI